AITALLSVDIVVFTALLHVTGGASNPFSFLYLVFLALAALMLEPTQTWTLVGASALGFGTLFLTDGQTAHHAHHGGDAMARAMRLHLFGMWLAFLVAATFIVSFLQRLTQALREREQTMRRLEEEKERQGHLASLGTLAAGAAHELSTPLSTIAVAASELLHGLVDVKAAADLLPDVRLIRAEVQRCRGILEQLAVDVGSNASDELRPIMPGALIELSLPEDDSRERVRVHIDASAATQMVSLPPRLCSRAIRGLVNNALQAGPGQVDITVEMTPERQQLRFRIQDQGRGMSPEVLSRATEPFFTTRAPGEGMGLGLFVAREVLERLGGELHLFSQPSAGTLVEVFLPVLSRIGKGQHD
ncbi:MAG: ATP-binding protein, partial [Myxococcota bacterium]